jgi:hypothetical protein
MCLIVSPIHYYIDISVILVIFLLAWWGQLRVSAMSRQVDHYFLIMADYIKIICACLEMLKSNESNE